MCIYIYMYIFMHMYAYTHAGALVPKHKHIPTYAYTHTQIETHNTHTHTRVHTRTYSYLHTHTHTLSLSLQQTNKQTFYLSLVHSLVHSIILKQTVWKVFELLVGRGGIEMSMTLIWYTVVWDKPFNHALTRVDLLCLCWGFTHFVKVTLWL